MASLQPYASIFIFFCQSSSLLIPHHQAPTLPLPTTTTTTFHPSIIHPGLTCGSPFCLSPAVALIRLHSSLWLWSVTASVRDRQLFTAPPQLLRVHQTLRPACPSGSSRLTLLPLWHMNALNDCRERRGAGGRGWVGGLQRLRLLLVARASAAAARLSTAPGLFCLFSISF